MYSSKWKAFYRRLPIRDPGFAILELPYPIVRKLPAQGN